MSTLKTCHFLSESTVVPEHFSYKRVPDKDCVGNYYVNRTDTRDQTQERVAYSGITDTNSIYVLKTVHEEENVTEYWDFGDGWDHMDDFLYNAAFTIFRGFDNNRFFEIIVNLGRIKDYDNLSIIATETYEQAISLHIPADLRDFDAPGLAGEESVTGDAPPVMFNPNDVLEDLYWVMREFSPDHDDFQQYLDGETAGHELEARDSYRAYQAVALAYPFFEGLVYQLADRVKLKSQPIEGEGDIQFRHLTSPKDNVKNLLQGTLHQSHGVLSEYEQDFLVDTFSDESTDLGLERNQLAHNIFNATRGFQSIDWNELTRRLIVSIAFLNEKVVCTFSPLDATNLQVFEEWLRQREQAGLENLRDTIPP